MSVGCSGVDAYSYSLDVSIVYVRMPNCVVGTMTKFTFCCITAKPLQLRGTVLVRLYVFIPDLIMVTHCT